MKNALVLTRKTDLIIGAQMKNYITVFSLGIIKTEYVQIAFKSKYLCLAAGN